MTDLAMPKGPDEQSKAKAESLSLGSAFQVPLPDDWTVVMPMDDVRTIVTGILAEQRKLIQNDEIDAVVLKTIATVLTSFGINEDDRQELRADFGHLRRWRKSVEQAQSYTFRAIITVILTGFLGAVWLGIKAAFGK
jgi:hypothetical protein